MPQSTQPGTVQDVTNRLIEKRQKQAAQAAAPEEEEIETSEDIEDQDDDLDNLEENEEEQDDNPEPEPSEGDEDEEDTEDSSVLTLEDLEGYEVRIPVTVDGQESEVSLDELRTGYMKDADYRRKTAEVAEARKALEAEKVNNGELHKTIQQYAEGLTVLEQVLAAPYSEDALKQIKAEQGIEAYLEAKDQNDEFAKKVAAVRAEKSKALEILTKEQKAEAEKWLAKEKAALGQKLPELTTEQGQNRLFSYLNTLGYTDDQVKATGDHRLFVMAEKARKYDELQKKGALKVKGKKIKPLKARASHTGKEGQAVKESRPLRDARKRAAETGKTKDIAQVLLEKRKLRNKHRRKA